MQAQTSNDPEVSYGVCKKEEQYATHFTYDINSLQNDKPQSQNKVQTKYHCMFCALSYSQPGELKNHYSECVRRRQRSKIYDQSLGVCKKEEQCATHFTYEFNSLQNDKPQSENDVQTKYQCMFCALSYSQPGELKNHYSECIRRRQRSKIGDQSLAQKSCAKKNFLCEFCGLTFAYKSNFNVHSRIHTGEKPYRCYYCPRAFSNCALLRSHLKRHPGTEVYICTPCGRIFYIENEMDRHIQFHMKEDEYLAEMKGQKTAN